MTPADSIDFARSSILVLLEIIAPAMLTALIVGLGIGLLQALTQIQEMTLTFVPKLLVVALVGVLAVPYVAASSNLNSRLAMSTCACFMAVALSRTSSSGCSSAGCRR